MKQPGKSHTIRLTKPHAGQIMLANGSQRFNVISCGRRFGKTQYGLERVAIPAIHSLPTAWFAPSYRMLKEAWRGLIDILEPIIETKNAQERSIRLITGGNIDFWSLDDPRYVRGRKYAHIVIDEAAHARNMIESWPSIIRPLLTDYRGGADFLSTPNGKNNFFHELFTRPGTPKGVGFAAFHAPTASNPFIDQMEIEAARLELDALTFAQEYLAEFVDFVAMPFAYAFSAEKHVAETAYNPKLPLILSFDFGVDPMPAVALQVDHFPRSVKVLKEFHEFDGDVYRLLVKIKAWLMSLPQKPILKITGDPSGRARSPLAEGAANAYRIISSELNVHPDFIRVPAKFSIANSRALVNSVLEHIPFAVSPDCPLLIKDLKFVEAERDAEGKIRLKKTGQNAGARQSNETMTHLLDALRYSIHLEFAEIASKLNRKIDKIEHPDDDEDDDEDQ